MAYGSQANVVMAWARMETHSSAPSRVRAAVMGDTTAWVKVSMPSRRSLSMLQTVRIANTTAPKIPPARAGFARYIPCMVVT